jgi:hypothetical protein
MATYAKALTILSSWAVWPFQRINRRLDDRDAILRDALKNIEEKDAAYYPMVSDLSVELSGLPTAEALTGLEINGSLLLGGSTQGSDTHECDAGTDTLIFESVVPGEHTLTVVLETGDALAVAIDGTEITITFAVGDTSTELANYVNNNTDEHGAHYLINVTGQGADALAAADADTLTLTGTGDVGELKLGGTDIDTITAWGDDQILFDYDPTGLDSGVAYMLELRVNGILSAYLPLTADVTLITGDEIADGAVDEDALAASVADDVTLEGGAGSPLSIKENGVGPTQLAFYASAAEVTATGGEQLIAHGLGVAPNFVLIVVTEGHDGAGGAGVQMPDIAEGAHTETDVLVTVTAGAKFKVLAI